MVAAFFTMIWYSCCLFFGAISNHQTKKELLQDTFFFHINQPDTHITPLAANTLFICVSPLPQFCLFFCFTFFFLFFVILFCSTSLPKSPFLFVTNFIFSSFPSLPFFWRKKNDPAEGVYKHSNHGQRTKARNAWCGNSTSTKWAIAISPSG